ncbi:MAG: hypothetical protein GQ527_01505, partial [Bacteroidales bacterium]|nr:hypothetical protein [Bacteroidales bacterium]
MIKYIEQADINKKKWDVCIDSSVNTRVYANSWYLDVVAPNWSAFILDDYQAVFPIISGEKIGVSYLYQPAFTQQLGLFTPLLITPNLVEQFLKEVIKLFPFIQINLNSYNKTSPTFNGISKLVNHELDLISPYSILKKKYSKNLKRNIKKAHQAKLSIFKNLKPEALIQLFRENKGKKISNLKDEDYHKLNRLFYKAISKRKLEVWGAYTLENNLCAAAAFIIEERRCVFLFSGTDQEARGNGAMPYLIDSFIEAHANSKSILDFEGSNDNNLARFYRS